MNNNKGFTLVELLAVIVIMGILMMVAIPSVTRTIENSRKDTFVDIAKSYGNAARTLWTSDNLTCNGVVSSAVDDGDYYILINSKESAKESLPVLVDQGGKSSWGNRDVNGYVRVNVSTTPGEDTNNDGIYEVEPRRVTKFYVALSDGTHGLIDDNTLMMDELKRGNVVMTLSSEQLKKVELTVDDGRLDCAVDANGDYSCTAVTPIKNITGICVDDKSNVGVTGRVESDIKVTGLLHSDSENNGSSQNENYNDRQLLMNVNLPNQNSTVSYKVEVTNFGDKEMGIYQFNNLPNNLEYVVTGYNLQDKICGVNSCILGATKEFYITIKYKENGFNQSNIEYNLNLDVDFRRMYTISYKGITNNNYPTYVIDGGNLNINLVNQAPPKIIAYTNNEKTDKSLYLYENNVFTYNNVTGDLTLEYVEKVYLVTLPQTGYFKESAHINNIKTVAFVDYVDVPPDAIESYDLSKDSDNSITGWIDKDYNLYIGSEWNIYSKDLSNAFRNMKNLTSVVFNNLNTSETTNMSRMFSFCHSLTTLDLSNFDTRQVTTMRSMFNEVKSLTTLDVSSFDTSKVTAMEYMFYDMQKLERLDVSNFNTSNVTDMSYTFSNLFKITTLDLSRFNTSNVTNMAYMFSGTSGITTLNLSNFNTSKVKNMSHMFAYMSNLKNLNISNFNTSNVTDMSSMFNGGASLTSLDVSNFNTSKVTNMAYMFTGLKSLTSLNVRNFNTSKVTNMEYMFNNLANLTSLDVSSFDTSNVTKMERMFASCSNLNALDLRNFNTSKVTTMRSMFNAVHNATTIDVSSFDTSNVTTMRGMFVEARKLQSVNVSGFNTSKVTSMRNMFSFCYSLTNLDVSNFDTSNVTDMSSMFESSGNLTSLNLSNFNTSKVIDMQNMFKSCSLTSLDLRNASFDSVTTYTNMFYGVPSNIYIITKNDKSRDWLQSKLGVGKGTIVLPSEL